MRKILTRPTERGSDEAAAWLDLEAIAQVEVSSEDPAHPIERALIPSGLPGGWRAGEPGPQEIRLIFDQPTQITTVQLSFREAEISRTQEFLLRWRDSDAGPFRDIVRQGYHFSPPGTEEELEHYRVELAGVKTLELSITPEVSGNTARASLERLRLA